MRAARSLPLVLLTACVTSPATSELDRQIIGGSQTSTTAFPVVVGLQHGNGNWFCTGVLVDKDWVGC
jgi:secreted trypsin-like serine protease